MTGADRITVRLEPETARLIGALVDSGEFKNTSDVVRHAIEQYLTQRFPPENVEKVVVDVPKTSMSDLQALVMEGDSVSVDDAIRNAVREYLRHRKDTKGKA